MSTTTAPAPEAPAHHHSRKTLALAAAGVILAGGGAAAAVTLAGSSAPPTADSVLRADGYTPDPALGSFVGGFMPQKTLSTYETSWDVGLKSGGHVELVMILTPAGQRAITPADLNSPPAGFKVSEDGPVLRLTGTFEGTTF